MAARLSLTICRQFQTAADLLGKRWTALVVQQLKEGPRRYSDLAGKLDVVSERVLIQRLKELEGAGVVERRVYGEQPVRVEYRLTDKGRALSRVIGSLERWANEWIVATT